MFWKEPAHLAHATDAKAIGYILGEYLHSRCSLTSGYSIYNFKIGKQDMEFCLPKCNHIFALTNMQWLLQGKALIDREKDWS